MVPHRHTDTADQLPRDVARIPVTNSGACSQDPRDRARIEFVPEREHGLETGHTGPGQRRRHSIAPCIVNLRGHHRDYHNRSSTASGPKSAAHGTHGPNDDGDPEEWDVQHWQEINPVHTEALVQLTCGGPNHLPRRLLHCAYVTSMPRHAPRPAA